MEPPVQSKPRVSFEFEVEKVIGVSSDGCYQVQWAPAWVSKFHLIGCEHLILEFHMQQTVQEIKSEPEPEDGVQVAVPSPPVASEIEDVMERKCEMIIGELREQFSSHPTTRAPQEIAEGLKPGTITVAEPLNSKSGADSAGSSNTISGDGSGEYCSTQSLCENAITLSTVVQQHNQCSDNDHDNKLTVVTRFMSSHSSSKKHNLDKNAGGSNTSTSANGSEDYCSTQSSENPPILLSMVELVNQHNQYSDNDHDEKVPVETNFTSPLSSNKMHNEDKPCSCNYKCRLRKRSDESAYSCFSCNDKTNLKDRLRKRTGKEPSSDTHCNSLVISKTNEDGLRKHVGNETYFHPNCNSWLRDRTRFKYCSGKRCNEVYDCKNVLHDKTNSIAPGHHHPSQKKYVCSLCSYETSHKRNFKSHQLTHTGKKPYECKECGKSFAQKVNLNRHFLTHSSEKTFRCDICSESFTRMVHLKRHTLTHSTKDLFTCSTCSKQFSRKDHLKEHLRVHSDERPLECSICKKLFKQRSYLTRHKRIHDGVKPFCCEGCGKRFTESSNRIQHLRHCANAF